MVLEAIGGGILLGLVVLLAAPPLLTDYDIGSSIGNWYGSIAMQTLRSPAISVSPNTTLRLKRRYFDDEYGSEKISVGDIARRITQTPGSIGQWGGRPFAFVDEKFGSTFSLRDVLVGYREHQLRQDGEMIHQEYQYDEETSRLTGMQSYVRAFFEFSTPQSLSMDLSESIHPVTDGAEDATAWDRVREGVRRMYLPQQQSTGILKLALPVLATIGGFVAGQYLFGPAQLPGGSATPDPVAVGAVLLFVGGHVDLNEMLERLRAVEMTTWTALAAGLIAAILISAGLITIPVVTTAFLAAFIATVVLLPLGSASVISVLPGAVAEPIADTWMTLGLKAFDDPIIRETATSTYRVEECADLPVISDSPRYRFCKAWVGFTCDVSPEAFGEAAVRGSELGDYRTAPLTDGGASTLPDGHEPTDAIINGNHEGFLPSYESMGVDRGANTFVRTDRWLARFKDASTGAVTERAQQIATKEFAGGEPAFSDRQIMIFGMVGLFIGLGLSFAIWGL